MGFSNDSRGGSGRFANFKDGKIITKIDGENKTYTSLSGLITAIYIDDAEYQGKEYKKINVRVQHEEGETILGFPLSSGYGNAFCRILPNVDPTREVVISGGTSKDEKNPDRKYGNLFMEQNGENLKWYFSSKTEHGKKVPEIVETTVGRGSNKKTVKDYSEREDFFEGVIAKFDAKLQKLYGKKEKPAPQPKTADEVTEPIDDLPF